MAFIFLDQNGATAGQGFSTVLPKLPATGAFWVVTFTDSYAGTTAARTASFTGSDDLRINTVNQGYITLPTNYVMNLREVFMNNTSLMYFGDGVFNGTLNFTGTNPQIRSVSNGNTYIIYSRISGATPQIADTRVNFENSVNNINTGDWRLINAAIDVPNTGTIITNISSSNSGIGIRDSLRANIFLSGNTTNLSQTTLNSTPARLSGTISGIGTLSMRDIILSGNNTYTGTTNITNTTTQNPYLNSPLPFGSGTVYLYGGAYNFNNYTIPNFIILEGHSIANTVIDINNITLNSGSLQQNVVLTGSGPLIKYGPGTLILSGSDPYIGETIISGGNLYLRDAWPLINTNRIFINRQAELSLSGNIETPEITTELSGGTIRLFGGNLNYRGNILLNSSSLIESVSGNFIINAPTTISSSRVLFLSASSPVSDIINSASIVNSGTIIKRGPGEVILNGPISGTGVFRIDAGTATVNNAGAINRTIEILTGSTLNYKDLVITNKIINLNSGTIITPAISSSILSMSAGVVNLNFNTDVTLFKTGSTTVTLSGNYSSFDNAIIRSGRLIVKDRVRFTNLTGAVNGRQTIASIELQQDSTASSNTLHKYFLTGSLYSDSSIGIDELFIASGSKSRPIDTPKIFTGFSDWTFNTYNSGTTISSSYVIADYAAGAGAIVVPSGSLINILGNIVDDTVPNNNWISLVLSGAGDLNWSVNDLRTTNSDNDLGIVSGTLYCDTWSGLGKSQNATWQIYNGSRLIRPINLRRMLVSGTYIYPDSPYLAWLHRWTYYPSNLPGPFVSGAYFRDTDLHLYGNCELRDCFIQSQDVYIYSNWTPGGTDPIWTNRITRTLSSSYSYEAGANSIISVGSGNQNTWTVGGVGNTAEKAYLVLSGNSPWGGFGSYANIHLYRGSQLKLEAGQYVDRIYVKDHLTPLDGYNIVFSDPNDNLIKFFGNFFFQYSTITPTVYIAEVLIDSPTIIDSQISYGSYTNTVEWIINSYVQMSASFLVDSDDILMKKGTGTLVFDRKGTQRMPHIYVSNGLFIPAKSSSLNNFSPSGPPRIEIGANGTIDLNSYKVPGRIYNYGGLIKNGILSASNLVTGTNNNLGTLQSGTVTAEISSSTAPLILRSFTKLNIDNNNANLSGTFISGNILQFSSGALGSVITVVTGNLSYNPGNNTDIPSILRHFSATGVLGVTTDYEDAVWNSKIPVHGLLAKYGNHNLHLSGAGAESSGTFFIFDGEIAFASGAFGSRVIDLANGGLQYSEENYGYDLNNNLDISSQIRIRTGNTGYIDIPSPNSNVTFLGPLNGVTGTISKNGLGNLNIIGAQNFPGNVEILNGTLTVYSGNYGNGRIFLKGGTLYYPDSIYGITSGTTTAGRLVFDNGKLSLASSLVEDHGIAGTIAGAGGLRIDGGGLELVSNASGVPLHTVGPFIRLDNTTLKLSSNAFTASTNAMFNSIVDIQLNNSTLTNTRTNTFGTATSATPPNIRLRSSTYNQQSEDRSNSPNYGNFNTFNNVEMTESVMNLYDGFSRPSYKSMLIKGDVIASGLNYIYSYASVTDGTRHGLNLGFGSIVDVMFNTPTINDTLYLATPVYRGITSAGTAYNSVAIIDKVGKGTLTFADMIYVTNTTISGGVLYVPVYDVAGNAHTFNIFPTGELYIAADQRTSNSSSYALLGGTLTTDFRSVCFNANRITSFTTGVLNASLGPGNFTKSGVGDALIAGNLGDYRGSINVSAGSLKFDGYESLGNGDNMYDLCSVTGAAGASIIITENNSAFGIYGPQIRLNGGRLIVDKRNYDLTLRSDIFLGAASTLAAVGTSSYVATLDPGVSGVVNLGTFALTVDVPGAVDNMFGSTISINPPVVGTGGVIKHGSGTLYLNDPRYSGATTVNSGSLYINMTNIGASTITINNESYVDLLGTVGPSASRFILNNGIITNGTILTAQIPAGNLISGFVNTPITGSSAIGKAGAGTVTLTGPNTDMSNVITVAAGVLRAEGKDPLGQTYIDNTLKSQVTVSAGAVLEIGDNFDDYGTLTNYGSQVRLNGGRINFNAINSLPVTPLHANISLGANSIISTTGSFYYEISNMGTDVFSLDLMPLTTFQLIFDSDSRFSFLEVRPNITSTTGRIVKTGPGTVRLSGENSGYSGSTLLLDGELKIPFSFGRHPITGSGGILSLENNLLRWVNKILLSGSTVLSGVLDANQFNPNGFLTGVVLTNITGVAGLIKNTPGDIMIGNNTTHTGLTNVTAGRLIISGSTTHTSSFGITGSNATLQILNKPFITASLQLNASTLYFGR